MSWFKNIFKKRNNKMTQIQTQQQKTPQITTPRQHKFDIIVTDIDQGDGPVEQTSTEQNGIYATSVEELRMLYQNCGQTIQILREYDENGNLVRGTGMPMRQPGMNMNSGGFPPDMLTPEEAKRLGIKMLPVEMPKFPPQQQPIQRPVQRPVQQQSQQQIQPIEKPQEKPKYFSIGGVDCKQLGNQIFQKQWVRVDSRNYRLISDGSNKELPLTGKHIEVLKWVLVENEDDQVNVEEENNDE
jgi:hypothetical protein